MREHYNCHEQCKIGLCPSACDSEGFCYFSEPEVDNGTGNESKSAIVPELLMKQSLIINSKHIESNESKCFRPGLYNQKAFIKS